MSSPHDALFKAVFGQPDAARAHLASVLRSRLVEQLDLDALVQRPGTFVDDELRSRYADLLFELVFLG